MGRYLVKIRLDLLQWFSRWSGGQTAALTSGQAGFLKKKCTYDS